MLGWMSAEVSVSECFAIGAGEMRLDALASMTSPSRTPGQVHTFFFPCISGRMVLTRFRLLITSVLSEIGRGRPCSLRNKPQALQRTAPYSSRRHRGVVEVLQFWQVGCEALEAIFILWSLSCCNATALIEQIESINTIAMLIRRAEIQKTLPHAPADKR